MILFKMLKYLVAWLIVVPFATCVCAVLGVWMLFGSAWLLCRWLWYPDVIRSQVR
jgi:hypothetical protein